MSTTTKVNGPIVSNFTSGGTAPGVFQYKGGNGYLICQGTFGSGGSIKLQMLGPDGTNYVDMTTTINALGATALNLPRGQYKPVLAGGAMAGFYAAIIPLD